MIFLPVWISWLAEAGITAAGTLQNGAKPRESLYIWLIVTASISVIAVSLALLMFFKTRKDKKRLEKQNAVRAGMEREVTEAEYAQILIEATPTSCTLIDPSFNALSCNQATVDLFKASGKDEIIKSFYDFAPEYQPDGKLSQEAAAEYIEKAFQEGSCVIEWMHQTLDGEPIPCEVTLVRVKYKEAYIVAGYALDIRERKAALAAKQKALDAKNAIDYLSSILNSLEVMVSVTDPKTFKLLFINDYMKQHFGVQGEAIGQVCYKAIHKRDKICDYCPCAELEQEPERIIVWEDFIAATGRIYRNVDRCICWPDGRSVYMRHSVDITELVGAKEEAERSNHAKDVFLAHMSHEIRTPMNAVLGISEIQLYDKTLSTEAREGFNRIYESGNLLLNIINDILDLSKIDADKLQITPVKYSLPGLINGTARMNHLRYESKPIEFCLNVSGDIPLELIGDELRVKQILNNLLSNAFKYTEAGEVKLSASAETGPDNETVTLTFQISDTGQGMNEDQIGRLYDAYARFNMEENRDITGTGLGMNITKRLIDLMNGEIDVKSETGKGSVFTVRLPQKDCGSDRIGEDTAERLQRFSYRDASVSRRVEAAHDYMPYGRVLIVDDMESNLYVAKGLMAPYGLHIETAGSGLDAIGKIESDEDYDIIFMDHMMPKMDGIQAAKIIRDSGYTNSIVALTANAVVGQPEMFLSNGFDGFLSKPIDSRELDHYLKTMIRDKTPPEIIEAARREQSGMAMRKNVIPPRINMSVFAKFFIRDAENAMDVLNALNAKIDALDDADMKSYMTTVHGMRSTLANIGETKLAGFASELELAGNEKDYGVITGRTSEFIEALRTLTDEIKASEADCAVDISNENLYVIKQRIIQAG